MLLTPPVSVLTMYPQLQFIIRGAREAVAFIFFGHSVSGVPLLPARIYFRFSLHFRFALTHGEHPINTVWEKRELLMDSGRVGAGRLRLCN